MSFTLPTETLPEHALCEVTLRTAQPDELRAARAAEHYLGVPKPVECDVVQRALRRDRVLAILAWTRGTRRLAARDARCDWDPHTRGGNDPALAATRAARPRRGSFISSEYPLLERGAPPPNTEFSRRRRSGALRTGQGGPGHHRVG